MKQAKIATHFKALLCAAMKAKKAIEGCLLDLKAGWAAKEFAHSDVLVK